ncbi:MAG TPA: DUF2399 domain-containing protein [Steroidobacteraceae bacterium]|nr:DUF2399 domain-containing protein [Steroidobacteraceae bacterium]
MTAPDSLRSPELDSLWVRARARLESRGQASRGRIPLPALSSAAKLTLKALIGRPLGKTVDLAMLEAGLARLGMGVDLASALAKLGHDVSEEPARQRALRAERKEARHSARAMACEWPEPWAKEWINDVIRAGILRGFDREQARVFMQRTRAVLDHLEQDRPAPISRVDLAARVLGSAHALDSGTRVEAAIARALAFKLGPADHRDLWAQAGVHFDLTSAPALTWRLPVTDGCGLVYVAAEALCAGIPLHLSRFALEKYPAEVPRGSRILVAENPRVVEAAAQVQAATPVVATNGRPSSTVLLLLTQLLDAGAELRYHGDFDTAGLAICGSLMKLGLAPWRMTKVDYTAALAAADAEGAVLPKDRHAPGPTPWDPALRDVFDGERRIVHEERLLPGLIEAIV